MKLTVSEIMAATQATGDVRPFLDTQVSAVTADSRAVAAGSLFCCLPGSRADGHDFAAAAVEQGAAAVLSSHEMPELNEKTAVLVVDDVLAAMGLLARFWRRRTRSVVAALSGSAGKTTAKELLASIVSRMAPSIKNPGNFNNQLGLPLSMLAAEAEHRVWVLELGISRPGDMEELAAICEPDLAVVHNIGPAHLEGLGDLAGVGAAKASLFSFVRPGGVALANADYPELWAAARNANPDVLAISTRDSSAPFFCRFVGCAEDGRGLYHLSLQGETVDAVLPCRGEHLTENVLAAAAAANVLGATPDQIAAGLSEAVLPARRFDVRDQHGYTVIDDSYNANPLSMAAAIESARKIAGDRPLVLVLGEMGELGQEADTAHEELGRCIARGDCDVVFFKGSQASNVERGLQAGNFAGRFHAVQEPDEFASRLENENVPAGTVLFKGSRSQRMEDFLERFLASKKEGGK